MEEMWGLHWLLYFLQGSGRYSIYIANYANGRVGPHALIEMDPAASDPKRGIVALNDVAADAGVNKLTGIEDVQQIVPEHPNWRQESLILVSAFEASPRNLSPAQ